MEIPKSHSSGPFRKTETRRQQINLILATPPHTVRCSSKRAPVVMSKLQSLQESSLTDKLLSKSAKGVTFLLVAQVFTKLCTFFLNQMLIIYISPKSFGINAFLEFLMSTSLFFSREAIRLTAQRIKDHGDEQVDEKKENKYDHNKLMEGTRLATLQSIINISYIPLMIGLPIATGLMTWQYTHISDIFKHMELFNSSLCILWAAIIIELLSEPFYILNQFNLNYDKRATFESTAVTLSCFTNFGIVFWFRNQEIDGIAIVAFAVAKLVHSTVLLVAYYLDFRRFKKLSHDANRLHLFPVAIQKGDSSYYFDADSLSHFSRVFFNIAFKHLLTEGDKLVINTLCTIEEQGIYSLISNYGSLLARLVFAPLEESLRNFLTRLLLSAKSLKNMQLSVDIIKTTTRFYIYLSLLIVIFGPLNSGYLIQKLIGDNWSNHVADTMPIYTLYIPLMAFNGILEAVHQSTASGNEVMNYTYSMIGFSIIFLFTSYGFITGLKYSLQGLILSNMINMALRIAYCYRFVGHYFKKNNVKFEMVRFDNDLKAILYVGFGVFLVDLIFFGTTRNISELFGNCVLGALLVGFMMFKEKTLIMSFLKRKPLV